MGGLTEKSMRKIPEKFKRKKLIVFDLDGTLAPSKRAMLKSTALLFKRLLQTKPVAVIGGGKYELFKNQLLKVIKLSKEELKNLFLFPTSSTSFYRFQNDRWRCIYSHELSVSQKKKINKAFGEIFEKLRYEHPKKKYGIIIEDRGTQITFSPLGQMAPVRLKELWNRSHNPMRLKMAKMLQGLLPEFKVRAGGLTSIDVTEKGIDKAYGIRQIEKHLRVMRKDMIFVGDAIFPGGNDYAVVRAGVDYVRVNGPEETGRVIRFLLGQ